MSSKLWLAAAGLAGAAVAIIKKLDKIEAKLQKIEESEKVQSDLNKADTWEDAAEVVLGIIRRREEAKNAPKQPKHKVVFSAAKGVSKVAGRAAWNKITRKDK